VVRFWRSNRRSMSSELDIDNDNDSGAACVSDDHGSSV
jgi:hypothetical protein